MSGAAEGLAGLALSAISVAALPDIRPGVERVLNNIKSLLEEGSKINKKYGDTSQTPELTSQGMQIFKTSSERFESRIRKHQKDTSAWKVTSWAVHDARKFESLIELLKRYVDGLENITISLGLLKDQHSRLRQEIDSISDVESLRLLRDATSSHTGSATLDVSDTASSCLVRIEENEYITRNITRFSSAHSSILLFKTALSKRSQVIDSLISSAPQPPGAWPQFLQFFIKNTKKGAFLESTTTCEQCLYDDKICVTNDEILQCRSCIQTGKNCSFSRRSVEVPPTTSKPVFHGLVSLDHNITNKSSTSQRLKKRSRAGFCGHLE
ncbi:hypothetical protein BOTCAL_0496g00060 [Botryotinia calthae]|uniref:Prion-inhibition and propagation HeLo domain-containing protein n=1 Tax=Botryotinia calthae TaxID=38488 RepID=A0A4Y8CNB0_9HELO|nr:hypothetical protein BOTCAL_0496g00060 [Botryotinia calthae]